MAMSRKDFVEIAEACASTIRQGHVKKKDIDGFIETISSGCNRCNYNFDWNIFETYVKERL